MAKVAVIYEAVTGNNKLFWVISLKNLDSSGETLARTTGIDCQKMAFEQEWVPHWPVCLQSSCSDSAECKFEKSLGFQNMCHSAIGMEHKLIHGQ